MSDKKERNLAESDLFFQREKREERQNRETHTHGLVPRWNLFSFRTFTIRKLAFSRSAVEPWVRANVEIDPLVDGRDRSHDERRTRDFEWLRRGSTWLSLERERLPFSRDRYRFTSRKNQPRNWIKCKNPRDGTFRIKLLGKLFRIEETRISLL